MELSINGRKTECFDDGTPTPKGFQIGGLLTFFPPARNLSSARALGDGELLPSSAALTQSASYCYPLSRKPTTKSGPLKEPALLLLAMHWFGSGLNASCDPDFSILGAGATDLELNILAACETKQTLPNGAGDPLGATTWHLKLQARHGHRGGSLRARLGGCQFPWFKHPKPASLARRRRQAAAAVVLPHVTAPLMHAPRAPAGPCRCPRAAPQATSRSTSKSWREA